MSEKSVNIPDDLLDTFAGLENGNGHSAGVDTDPDLGARKMEMMAGITDTLKWVTTMMDDAAKDNDLPGLGGVTPEQFARLAKIVAERNLSPEILEKSPEFALGSISAGILVQNLIALQRNRKEEKNESDAAE